MNYRRGGEPARLLLKDYQGAVNDIWLDHSRLDSLNLTPLEKSLVEENKIGYMVGKGDRLVPIILPVDTLPALSILSDAVHRRRAGVSNNNPYLFPSSRNSEEHLSGWHGLDEVCKCLTLEKRENICGTKNRHLVSTVYSLLELPSNERSSFFDHMGHSKTMNEARYQCPAAIKELTVVGKRLHNIDKGKVMHFDNL